MGLEQSAIIDFSTIAWCRVVFHVFVSQKTQKSPAGKNHKKEQGILALTLFINFLGGYLKLDNNLFRLSCIFNLAAQSGYYVAQLYIILVFVFYSLERHFFPVDLRGN